MYSRSLITLPASSISVLTWPSRGTFSWRIRRPINRSKWIFRRYARLVLTIAKFLVLASLLSVVIRCLSCCCCSSLRFHEQRRHVFTEHRALPMCRRLPHSRHQLPTKWVNSVSLQSLRPFCPHHASHTAAGNHFVVINLVEIAELCEIEVVFEVRKHYCVLVYWGCYYGCMYCLLFPAIT